MSAQEGPIDRPDTELAAWAQALLYERSDRELAHHCERSFQFAALLAAREGLAVDIEVVSIA